MRFFGCSLAGKILKDVNRYINEGRDNFTFFFFFLLKHNCANIYCILSNEKKKRTGKNSFIWNKTVFCYFTNYFLENVII